MIYFNFVIIFFRIINVEFWATNFTNVFDWSQVKNIQHDTFKTRSFEGNKINKEILILATYCKENNVENSYTINYILGLVKWCSYPL